MSRRNKITALIVLVMVIAMVGALGYISSGKGMRADRVSVESFGNIYDATMEIKTANNKLKEGGNVAAILGQVKTEEKVVAITFDGMVDQETTGKLLQILDKHNTKAIFFIPGIKGAEDPETVKIIARAGQAIGNYTLHGNKEIAKLSSRKLIEDFCQTNVILRDITGREATLLKANTPKYTKKVLQSSYATGLESVVYGSNFLSYQSFTTQKMATEYVKGLEKGSVISIKTDGVLDDWEYEKPVRNKQEIPAIDPDLGLNTSPLQGVDPNKRLLDVVAFLLTALAEEDYKIVPVDHLASYEAIVLPKDKNTDKSIDKMPPKVIEKVVRPIISKPKEHTSQVVLGKPQTGEDLNAVIDLGLNVETEPGDYQQNRIQNKGAKAKIRSYFNTTDPTVAYTFRNVGDKDILEDILNILDELDAKATFFVTGKEIIEYPENIRSIIDRGQSIANGGYGMITSSPRLLDFDSLSYEIDMGERYLKAFLGADYSKEGHGIYMPLYGDVGGHVLEAAAALGYKEVTTYNRSAIQKKYIDLDGNEIINQYFSNVVALSRGDIVHFRLDYLRKQGAVQEIVRKTAENYIKNATYSIGDIASLAASPLRYSPKSKESVAGTGDIRKEWGYPIEHLDSLVVQNYIGNPDISSSGELFEFSETEIAKINKKGKIKTQEEKVIFLTFDDWGSDASITPLLNTLNKYHAKATFFIRVGSDNLSYESDFINPNLLRAIALDGHDIGNHTFKHFKINISGEDEKRMLQYDVLTAHEEMLRYIGDTAALKSFFRPPTLAVSKTGLETIFDMGYDYIINGDFSSHDYEATSAVQLINRLKNGINIKDSSQEVNELTPFEDRRIIENGSIVVMHMSDESAYTAEALETIIPYYMDLGYRFAKLSDYLKDGYHNEPIEAGDE